jgi:hypothetical protein
VTGYCFGILAAILVIFFIVYGLMHLRRWLTHGKIKRASRDPLCRNGLELGSVTGLGEEVVETKEVAV